MSTIEWHTSGAAPERVRYFSEQLLTADDMTTEQEYFRRKSRRHNRFLHGWGVVCGLGVTPAPNSDQPWRLCVTPGYAVSPQGDEIVLDVVAPFDLAGDWLQAQDPCTPYPCPPTGRMPAPGQDRPVYLAIRFAQCDTRPVRQRVHECCCDETGCEYSRIRDSWELMLLWEEPESHRAAAIADEKWQTAAKAAIDAGQPLPTPPCPPATDDPWVVLAAVTLPADPADPVTNVIEGYRRQLLTPTCLSLLREI
jgi:hypothetical protein